jgi:hypothetical protein
MSLKRKPRSALLRPSGSSARHPILVLHSSPHVPCLHLSPATTACQETRHTHTVLSIAHHQGASPPASQSMTWGMRTRCDTHDDLVVEPQNHPALWMAVFVELDLKTRRRWFRREPVAARGGTTKGASKRSNFVWSAWSSDRKPRSWYILPLAEWICSM